MKLTSAQIRRISHLMDAHGVHTVEVDPKNERGVLVRGAGFSVIVPRGIGMPIIPVE